MSEAPKTVWVTEYALEEGILECPAVEVGLGMVKARLPSSLSGEWFFSGNDWHPTREAALARAEEMRAAKIASLRRQIERLESLEF